MLWALMAVACVGFERGEHVLEYSTPANLKTGWTSALPVGNGRLGAMVFGGTVRERIQLNEISIWAGPPYEHQPADSAATLAKARSLWWEGKYDECEAEVRKMMAPRISPRSYQTMGDLWIALAEDDTPPDILVEDWQRAEISEADLALLESGKPVATPQFVNAPLDGLAVGKWYWYRAIVNVPDAKPYQHIALSPIDDFGRVFVNGKLVGQTTSWDTPSSFEVSGYLKRGQNEVWMMAKNGGGVGTAAREVRLVATPPVSGYTRKLNLERAEASTVFVHDGVEIVRRVFASIPDQVLVVEMSTNQPGSLDIDVWLDRPEDAEDTWADREYIGMRAQAQHGGKMLGVKFETVTKIVATGKGAAVNKGHVTGADTVRIYLDCKTDYNLKAPAKPLGRDLFQAAMSTVDKAAARSDVRRRAAAAHASQYSKVRWDVDGPSNQGYPTDYRLATLGEGADVGLETLYLNFGRYLLISSSQPGSLPANLQGLWSDHIDAPWHADYHTNINLQMNYWPAEVLNLSPNTAPFFDLIDGLAVNGGREMAARLGCSGACAGHTTDAWLGTSMSGQPVWGAWVTGLAWCSQHYMEHFRFTQDRKFLKERCWPMLKANTEFALDWLVADPATGLLVSGPVTSPENTFVWNGKSLSVAMGTSMDTWIFRELLLNTLEAATELGIENSFTARARTALAKMAKVQVGSDGRLLEWAQPFGEAEPGHRHMSHLYGLHPGNQVAPGSAEWAAARASLEARLAKGGGHTGWSRAWIISFWARLLQGEKAHENLVALLRKSTLPNLFDNHPPFQIDGNFGGAAGMAEMVVQSHESLNGKVLVRAVPAIPAAWPTGTVTGLRARGGLGVDVHWDGSQAKLTVTTTKQQDVYFATGDLQSPPRLVRLMPGRPNVVELPRKAPVQSVSSYNRR